jgi:hypothetical protein
MLQPGSAGAVQSDFLDDQTKQICALFNAALADKYPDSALPIYSPETQELLRGAWLLAKQMRNRLITREHLIVALLRGRPVMSLKDALIRGYDDQALLAGAFIRISTYKSYDKAAAIDLPGEDPLLSDTLAQYQDNDEFSTEYELYDATSEDQHQPLNRRTQPGPLLRWIHEALQLAAGLPLQPSHFQAYAVQRNSLRDTLRKISTVGRPLIALGEWENVKISLAGTVHTARDNVIRRTDAVAAQLTPVAASIATINENVNSLIQRQPDATGHLVTLGRNLSSALGDVSSKLAAIDNRIATQPGPHLSDPKFDPRRIVDTLTQHTAAAHHSTVELLSRPLASLDNQTKALLAKLIEANQQKPRPPSAGRLALLVIGSIMAGIGIAILIRACAGDPAMAGIVRIIGF